MKNLKKSVIIGVIIILVLTDFTQVYAKERKENGINTKEIEELFQERNQLSNDYDNNTERIEEIDNKLEALGVEDINYDTLRLKINGVSDNKVSALIAINSSSTIKWTSLRQVTVFRGKEYEVQIIRGVPSSSNSELIGSRVTTSIYSNGFLAASKEVLKVVVPSIAGYTPIVGNGISASTTFYSAFKSAIPALTGQSYIDGVKCSYTTSLVANYVYVFIKYYGDIDTGNQVLGYAGNTVNYSTIMCTPGTILVNNKYYANVSSKKVSGTISSPFYTGYINKASENFWNYKNYNINFSPYYFVTGFNQKMVSGSSIFLVAPTPNSGY